MKFRASRFHSPGVVLALAACCAVGAQNFDEKLFPGLHWRLIGPFRGGRVTAVAGIPGEPGTYYFGTPGGGVWKTTDAGHVWRPIFDQQHVASIGAIALAPSDPKILYVGTGEQTQGNGVYRSADSGATWTPAGLRETRFIQAIIVDPHNPNVAVAGANSLGQAILWRPVPKSAFSIERGIYKTTDGGKTWKKVLSKDDTIGVVDLCADPSQPRNLYAVLFRPASGTGASAIAATSEIYKSTDGGSNWKPLASTGLPEKDRGRLGLVVASGNHGRRLYAVLNQGFYRSDDGGASWQQSTKDPRIAGSEYFSRIFVDPNNPDVLYVAQTSLYRSTDGGHTFEAYVGAPSGDDFHVLWIDPQDSARMLLGVDQGAIISVDGGATWSSWYNQPTGQFYHVSTDNAFPYRVYGAQQDSGTAAVLSRSDYGEITAHDWMPIGGFEYCFIVADPGNPDLVYSGGWYGTVVRFDRKTGQPATVFERGEKYRTAQMAPLMFSPQDPHTLYLGTQFVLKTADGGMSWQAISPDLTGYTEPAGEEKPPPDQPPPPAISTLSPSPLAAGEIWAGTTNRVVQVTRDAGATWKNVSPTGLAEPERILSVEASHHDAGTAYIAAGATRESTPPYLARTHDYGQTWQKIVAGLPEREMARVIREDPVRKGLLYTGTDTGVFVSFDDGDHWKPLQLNLPTATVTDLDVRGNDLVASTFGRAFWILDDVTPLRGMRAEVIAAPAYLFPPASAMRVRWDNNQDTPLPPETPAGQNPPDGAILDYFLKSAPAGDISLTIFDEKGDPVRKFSSRAESPKLPPANVPSYWFAPPEALPKVDGVNRFVWDLRYAAPPALPYSYFGGLLDYTEYTLADHAIPGDTPRQQPQGPLVAPGNYTVELIVDGEKLRQALTVKLDPRVHASDADLREQLDLEQKIGRGMTASFEGYHQIADLRAALTDRKKTVTIKSAVEALEKKIDAIDQGKRTSPGFGPVNRDLTRLATSVQSGDTRPSEPVRAAVEEKCRALSDDLAKWSKLNEEELVSFNATLTAQTLAPLAAVKVDTTAGCYELR